MRGCWVAVGLTAASVLLGACTPDKGFQAEEISRSDYGDSWPLTANDAVLACEPGGIPTVTVEGRSYGLDDWADVMGKPPRRAHLTHVWATDDSGRLMDMDVLLEDALALCN